MSKATGSPIEPGSQRSAASGNAPFTAIAAAAASLDPYNFAEEGLDWRTIALNPHGERIAVIEETTRAAIAIQAGYGPTYQQGATVFRTGALGNIDIHTVLRVTVAMHVQTTLANGGFTGGATYDFRTQWNDGTTTFVLAERGFATTAFIAEDTLLFESWVIPAGAAAVSWVELQYRNSQIFRPKSTVLLVDRFKNINVTVY